MTDDISLMGGFWEWGRTGAAPAGISAFNLPGTYPMALIKDYLVWETNSDTPLWGPGLSLVHDPWTYEAEPVFCLNQFHLGSEGDRLVRSMIEHGQLNQTGRVYKAPRKPSTPISLCQ